MNDINDFKDRFTRSRLLFDSDFEKLQNAKVLVCGCGGVGGACIEALARSGIGQITAVDCDRFEITNQNRQFGSENLGQLKASVFEQKFNSVKALNLRIDENTIKSLDLASFDVIIDAIDDINAKILLAFNAPKKRLFSSLGTAKRIDPTKLSYASIWKSRGDAFGAKLRNRLKKAGFKGDFTCVFSSEEARCKSLGSCIVVTASAGLLLASLAIKKIIKKA